TDFACHDQIVTSNGGPHVIQAFLSEELSEETQIKGRTARQGGCGSYSLVLCEKALERFLITKNDIEKARKEGSFYPLLNSSRNRFFSTQYEDSKKYVANAARQHKKSEALITAVKNSDVATVKKILYQQNRGMNEEKCVRTMVLMDATGSMSHLLQKSKHAVSTMFERINIILEENNSLNNFEMQFAVYRNYNAPEDMLLQISPWESKPEGLRSFMEKVQPLYGDGNEAIEVALAYVNRELKTYDVSQVILIGDAPPNTRKEVEEKRRNSRHGKKYFETLLKPLTWFYIGENYPKKNEDWEKEESNQKNIENELRQLRSCNIP
ncbi:hypothetical protein RFI_35690, partial [Reticulomyxa filosa]